MQDAARAYWLDLFTGKTWDEFRQAGANITGFRQGSAGVCKRIHSGDILICYVTGVKRWVGALEVSGPSSDISRRIWEDDAFPVRLDVDPIVLLDAVHGVPMEDLEGKVAFFAGPQHHGGYKGFLRRSPNRFQLASDGQLLMNLLRDAESSRVSRPIDERAYRRRPGYLLRGRLGDVQAERELTVPEPEVEPGVTDAPKLVEVTTADTRHTEMQWELLQLGSAMGLDVWVASNDRGRTWKDKQLAKTPRLVNELPKLFNDVTNRTIELIDVLWLKGNSIYAAFEVEATTSVYSGLLRMSDLLALQPNLNINLFIVAPEGRRSKVRDEILRPTFQWRDRPLSSVCGYLPFSTVKEQAEGIRRLNLASSLKPDFLTAHAEYFGRSSSVEPTIPRSDDGNPG